MDFHGGDGVRDTRSDVPLGANTRKRQNFNPAGIAEGALAVSPGTHRNTAGAPIMPQSPRESQTLSSLSAPHQTSRRRI